jgi:hypothetical protein
MLHAIQISLNKYNRAQCQLRTTAREFIKEILKRGGGGRLWNRTFWQEFTPDAGLSPFAFVLNKLTTCLSLIEWKK